MMAAYISEVHFSPLFGDVAKHQYVELRGDAMSSMMLALTSFKSTVQMVCLNWGTFSLFLI